MAALKKLIARWQSLPFPWRVWRVVGYVAEGDEVPEVLPDKGVVLVGAPENRTWAAFDCPCQKGHRLMVNLDKSRRPVWNIDCLKPLTIRPSIDNIGREHRCHFLVRSGKIDWSDYDRRVTQ